MNKKFLGGLIAAVCIAAIIYVVITDNGFDDVRACSDWPMFQHDPQHSGFSDCDAPDSPSVAWKFKTNGEIYSSPVVADVVVFVGACNDGIYALNESNGEVMWRYEIESCINSVPAVAYGMVFVGLSDGKIQALDELSGELIWSFKANGSIGESSPTVSNGKVFIGVNDGKVYAINASDGELLWSETICEFVEGVSASSYIEATPTASDGMIFITPRDYISIFVLNESNGELVPKYNNATSIQLYGPVYIKSSQVVDDECVLIAGPLLFALNKSNGKSIWESSVRLSKTIDGWTTWISKSSPAAAYNKVFVGSASGNIYAFDRTTGKIVWEREMTIQLGKREGPKPNQQPRPKSIDASPAIADGKVFIVGGDMKFYALNESNGEIIWKYDLKSDSLFSPAIANGKVFVATNDGTVYAFEERDNTLYYIIFLIIILLILGVIFIKYVRH